jgi:hypothetical protein
VSVLWSLALNRPRRLSGYDLRANLNRRNTMEDLTVMCPRCKHLPMRYMGAMGDFAWYLCECCKQEKAIDMQED